MSIFLFRYEDDQNLFEAHKSIERAIGGIYTLHIGQMDHNVKNVTSDLRMAANLIEQFGIDNKTNGARG